MATSSNGDGRSRVAVRRDLAVGGGGVQPTEKFL